MTGHKIPWQTHKHRTTQIRLYEGQKKFQQNHRVNSQNQKTSRHDNKIWYRQNAR